MSLEGYLTQEVIRKLRLAVQAETQDDREIILEEVFLDINGTLDAPAQKELRVFRSDCAFYEVLAVYHERAHDASAELLRLTSSLWGQGYGTAIYALLLHRWLMKHPGAGGAGATLKHANVLALGAKQLFTMDVHSGSERYGPLFDFLLTELAAKYGSSPAPMLLALPPQGRTSLLAVAAAFLPYYVPPSTMRAWLASFPAPEELAPPPAAAPAAPPATPPRRLPSGLRDLTDLLTSPFSSPGRGSRSSQDGSGPMGLTPKSTGQQQAATQPRPGTGPPQTVSAASASWHPGLQPLSLNGTKRVATEPVLNGLGLQRTSDAGGQQQQEAGGLAAAEEQRHAAPVGTSTSEGAASEARAAADAATVTAASVSGHQLGRGADFLISEITDTLSKIRSESGLMRYLAALSALHSSEHLRALGTITKLRLQSELYSLTSAGAPHCAPRSVRHAAFAALDALFPLGKRTRYLVHLLFRCIHPSDWLGEAANAPVRWWGWIYGRILQGVFLGLWRLFAWWPAGRWRAPAAAAAAAGGGEAPWAASGAAGGAGIPLVNPNHTD